MKIGVTTVSGGYRATIDVATLLELSSVFVALGGEHITTQLSRIEALMKDVVEKFRKQEEYVDKAIARVQEDVTKWEEKLAELKEKVDAGTVSQEDLAEIETIHNRTLGKIAAIDPTKEDTLPPDDGTAPPDDGTLPADTLPDSGNI